MTGLIVRLLEAGTPPDLIEEVALAIARVRALEDLMATGKVDEDEKAQRTRAANAERQRRYRERHADENNADNALHNVTNVTSVTEPPSLDKSPPDPQKLNPSPPVCRTRARKADPFVLPDHIPADDWRAFEAMRVAARKPLTDDARRMAVKRLDKLAEAGWPPGIVLNHSTLNNYQGLYPPKDDGNAGSTRQPVDAIRGTRPDPALDMLALAAQRRAERDGAGARDNGDRGQARLALPSH